jgi:nucleotide-binding universal stress UspA family protein
MKSLKPKFRILVLYNSKCRKTAALPSGVNFAKRVQGAVELLSVNPIKRFASESNQVAVLRTLEEEKAALKLHLKQLTSFLAEEEEIPLIATVKVGVVKEVIADHIRLTTPDIVIMGSPKGITKQFYCSGILQLVMKNHKGPLLLATNTEQLKNKPRVNMGFINRLEQAHPLLKALENKVEAPISIFQFISAKTVEKQVSKKKEVVYHFQDSVSETSNFLKYIEQSKVNLLCVEKALFSFHVFQRFTSNRLINQIANLETPLLVFP